MFGKTFTITAFVAALFVQVHGHALVEPAIGVGKNGTGIRADVQRPSSKAPCGTVNVATVIKNSTAVFVDKDGVFSATGQNFNPGQDGSLLFKATIDPSASGDSGAFTTPANITKNGSNAPPSLGTEPLTIQLPSNVTCTGGPDGKSCLVSFVSASGFGNCVLVSQAQAAGNSTSTGKTSGKTCKPKKSGNNSTDSGASDTGSNNTSTDEAANVKVNVGKYLKRAVGTRAPRAFLLTEIYDFDL